MRHCPLFTFNSPNNLTSIIQTVDDRNRLQTCGITAVDAHTARSRCPCEFGREAPQRMRAESSVMGGWKGGGLVGEAESR